MIFNFSKGKWKIQVWILSKQLLEFLSTGDFSLLCPNGRIALSEHFLFFEGLQLKFIPALWKEAKKARFSWKAACLRTTWASEARVLAVSQLLIKKHLLRTCCVLVTGAEAMEGATNKREVKLHLTRNTWWERRRGGKRQMDETERQTETHMHIHKNSYKATYYYANFCVK